MKIIDYYKALYKGELLKKIEYKIKNKIGYFEKQTKKFPKSKNESINCFSLLELLNVDSFNEINTNINEELVYDFLNNKISIKDNIFEESESIIWSKCSLNKYGDVKNIWEINRLQFLVPLAIKFKQTKNIEYKNIVIKCILNWISNNKFDFGINWNSNLEVAIRAVNIYLAIDIIGEDVDREIKECLYLHGLHIYREVKYSDKCIPNNHIFGEATALLLLSKCFSESKWEKRAQKFIRKYSFLLDNEGISVEGSFGYQFFTTQMFIVCNMFLDNKYYDIITKSLSFLLMNISNNGNLINFGDDDDGYYFNFYWDKNHLKNIKLLQKIVKCNCENVNLLQKKEYDVYNDGKNYLMMNFQKERYHSHSDDLSIVLKIDGIDIFVDSGTYKYNGIGALRNYFRSSYAHNTITFSKKDHSTQIGTFRWIKQCEVKHLGLFHGRLNSDGNIFERKIENDKYLKITDKIKTNGSYCLCWHLSSEIEIKELGKNKYSLNDKYLLEFESLNDVNISIEKCEISSAYNSIISVKKIILNGASINQIITKLTKF